MSQPKVFEFAKEVGMTPLALMDKIREWELPVKSHMAELTPDLIETIRLRLHGPVDTESKKAAPKAAKKKAAPAASAPPVVTKATKPAVRKRAADAVAAASEAATSADESTDKKPAASTVVRRKKSDPTPAVVEETAELEATAAVVTAEEEKTIATATTSKEPSGPSPAPAVAAAAEATAAAAVAPAPAPTAVPVAPAAVQKPIAAGSITPSATEETTERKPVVARKKEVAIGNSGVSSEPSAAPIRRNIVGRMDLSRVQPPPGTSRPGMGPRSHNSGPGAGGQNAGGTGFASRGPRPGGNLRTGFVQSAPVTLPPTDRETDEEGRKRDERRRMKGGGAGDANSARELDENPPAFDAAEFRKREMVFQPKKKKGLLNRPSLATAITTPSARKRVLKVNGAMKVADVCQEMGIKAAELTKVLMKNGIMSTPSTALDFETLSLIVTDFGWEVQNVQKTDKEMIQDVAFGDLSAEPVERPPVVTIMGHVDHGKTSLLDSIRKTNVASGEAGGITQHIGAYQVALDDGYKLTFLDTPGHEAFTAMRARGANVTDIAIIVVAADDGMMPQTAEAINHAKAAGVPMIVAINKMDKPQANPEKIKQQLTELEVVPEEWGGTTIFCPVSAVTKSGIKEMLEQVRLLAEVGELKANPKRSGTGAVIEARLDKGRGPVATILVKDGHVAVGQYIVAGTVKGRVRSLMNDRGERVDEATPGMPVEILGLESVPVAGDGFDIVRDDVAADEVIRTRQEKSLAAQMEKQGKISLEQIFAKVKAGDVKELAVVLKADVHGSLEALEGMFAKIGNSEVKLKLVHSAVGGVTESDVLLASTAKGLIIGFNVRPDSGASAAAKRMGIEIRTYSIVYELIDDLKAALAGMLAPTIVEKVLGRAEVRNLFTVPKIGTIAGCFVSEGKILRASTARLIRNGVIIYEGKMGSLKRFKDDAREVATGFECGIGIENYNDVKVGDVIESFVKEEVARELTSDAQA